MTISSLLFIALITQAPQVAVHDSTHFESVILEVRIGTVASTVLSARRERDTAFLRTGDVFALAEMSHRPRSDGYLSVDSLAAIMHAAIIVDWNDLTAIITDDGSLPVSRRAARSRQRAQFNRSIRESSSQPPLRVVQPSLLPRDLIVDYDAVASAMHPSTNAYLRLGAGTNLLRGALMLDLTATSLGRPSLTGLSWEKALHGSSLRYARIGTVYPSRGSALSAGILISSDAPRHGDAAPIVMAGTIAPDWDVEAYRDGALIYAGRTDSLGRYRIVVPALRGVNQLTLEAYGPDAEERSSTRYVSVGADELPAHTVAYEVSAGRCSDSDCTYALHATMRYAPLTSIVAGFELDAASRPDGTGITPAVLLATRLRDDLSASARYGRYERAAELRYAPSPAFDASAAYTTRNASLASAAHQAHYSSASATGVWRLPWTGYSASAAITLSGHRAFSSKGMRMDLSLPLGRSNVRPFAELRHDSVSTMFDRGLYADCPTPFTVIAGMRVRAMLASPSSGSFVTLAAPLAHAGEWEIGFERRPGFSSPQLVMMLTFAARAAQYQLRSAAGGAESTTHTLSGSFSITSGSRAPVLSRNQMRGRAAIGGRVFLDSNSNGVLDGAEPLLSGVSVAAGDINVETDSSGRYEITDIQPYTAVVLSVDSLSLPSPDLSFASVSVLPLANGVTRVDIPVISRDPSHAFLRSAAATSDGSRRTRSAATLRPSMATTSSPALEIRTLSPTLGSRPRRENTYPPSVDQSPSGLSRS